MLDEHASTPLLALLLWQFLRDILLWSTTPALQRLRLFSSAAAERRRALLAEAPHLDPSVLGALRLLAAMFGSGPADPANEPPPEYVVSHGCRIMALWAEREGHGQTALAFAQAGALAMPTSGAATYEVGRLAARYGRLRRAITWLTRAIGVCRRSGEWRTYIESCRELGLLHERQGDPERARGRLLTALKTARRHKQRMLYGRVSGDLFRVAVALGAEDEAEGYASVALRLLPAEERAEVLLLLARLWLRQGKVLAAAQAAETVARIPGSGEIRLRALALQARALAAHHADQEAVGSVWMKAWTLLTAGDPVGRTAMRMAALDLEAAAADVGNKEFVERAHAYVRMIDENSVRRESAFQSRALP